MSENVYTDFFSEFFRGPVHVLSHRAAELNTTFKWLHIRKNDISFYLSMGENDSALVPLRSEYLLAKHLISRTRLKMDEPNELPAQMNMLQLFTGSKQLMLWGALHTQAANLSNSGSTTTELLQMSSDIPARLLCELSHDSVERPLSVTGRAFLLSAFGNYIGTLRSREKQFEFIVEENMPEDESSIQLGVEIGTIDLTAKELFELRPGDSLTLQGSQTRQGLLTLSGRPWATIDVTFDPELRVVVQSLCVLPNVPQTQLFAALAE